jgi:hypothetical protein
MASATSTTRVRRWRWRPNPLKRRSDRLEAWAVLCAFLVSAVGGTVLALLAWSAALDVAEEQRAERQRVAAVLTKAADPDARETFYQAPDADTSRAPVRWTAPDGTARHGMAEVPDGARAGASVPVWIAPDGSQTAPPAGAGMAHFQAGICALLASGTLIALVCAGHAGVRAALDRRRADAWERAWAEVEPRWRHRTP